MMHRHRWLAVLRLAALFALALPAVLAAVCATPGRDGSPTLSGVVNTYYPGTATTTAAATSIAVGTSQGNATQIANGDLLLVIQMQDAAINSSNSTAYGANNGSSSGSTNLHNSGFMEYVTATGAVGSVTAGRVPIMGANAGGLVNVYTNANATAAAGQRRFQVIRVPQYLSPKINGSTNPQVTALGWTGAVGGVLAIDVAGVLVFDSNTAAITVAVDGKGFRGGGGQTTAGSTGNNFANTDWRRVSTLLFDASKGEGIAGTPRFVYDEVTETDNTTEGYPNGSFARGAPGNAGGGGTDGDTSGSGDTTNQNNCGGGGGGNGGAGGGGGNCWNTAVTSGGFGGAAFVPSKSPAKAIMGGGAGAGDSNNAGPGHGGPGGGIIIIRANILAFTPVNGTATLTANGMKPCTAANTCTNLNGTGQTGSTQDGAGGGGAGGSILIDVNTTKPPGGNSTAGLTLNALGGNGGDVNWPDNDPHGPGGGGGGGLVYISAAGATFSTTHGGHGAAGNPTSDNIAFGSADGQDGTSATGPITFTGTNPGYTCGPSLALLSRFRAVPAAGALVLEWETASEAATAGFFLYRHDPRSRTWVAVNDHILPAALESPQGGVYRFVDEGASVFEPHTYKLMEIENGGHQRTYGPFTVAVDWRVHREAPEGGYERSSHAPTRPAPAASPGAEIAEGTGGRRGAGKGGGTIARIPAALKLSVQDRGLYVLKSADLANAFGLPAAVVQTWIAQGRFTLTNQGAQVAWHSSPDGSSLRFFGDALASIYSAANIYWLVPGIHGQTMGWVDGGAPSPLPYSPSYPAHIHFEQNLFAGTAVATDPTVDYWYWQAMISGDPTYGVNTFPVTIDDLAAGSTTASLTAHLQGATDTGVPGEHHVTVRLNGTPLGDVTWQGIAPQDATFSFGSSVLLSGANTIELDGHLDPGVPFSISYTNSFDLTYARLAATNGSPLFLTPDSGGPITVSGFASRNILVYDVTTAASPVVVLHPTIDAPFGSYRVSFFAVAGHTYLALDTSGYKAPGITAWIPPALPLLSPVNGADHLIIAPAALAGTAGALASYRQGQGLASQVVPLEEIYNEFNYGIASPLAVQSFLSYTAATWHKRPSFVVLAGAGTFDYRNYLGLGGNLVPPLMVSTSSGLFAADRQFTAFPGGNGMVVGRIPATSAAELQGVITKLIAYEGSPAGSWKQQVVLASDASDSGGEFDLQSNLAAAEVPPAYNQQSIDLSQLTLANARSQLLTQLDNGALLFNYVGHGGVDRLSSQSLLTNGDAAALTNGDRLPVLAAATCTIGRFEIPGFQSLAEALLENPSGGAAGVWAPSGIGFSSQSSSLDQALVAQIFAPATHTLADAVLAGGQQFLAAGGDASTLLTYNLFGDPALRLQKP
jgi:hypothetical protein